MTLLLASVTSTAEAETALAQGADIVDLKDPAAGALGALPVATVAGVVAGLDGACVTSATIGDLPAEPRRVREAMVAMAATGVDIVKMGLFERRAPLAFLRALQPPPAVFGRLVLVMFADRDPRPELLPMLAPSGFTGVMLDTADKRAGGLRECLPVTVLARFVREARALGLLAGLAGSLRVADIAPLLTLAPDLLGFRTALCGAGGRTADIDSQAVRVVREHIPRDLRAQVAGATRRARSA